MHWHIDTVDGFTKDPQGSSHVIPAAVHTAPRVLHECGGAWWPGFGLSMRCCTTASSCTCGGSCSCMCLCAGACWMAGRLRHRYVLVYRSGVSVVAELRAPQACHCSRKRCGAPAASAAAWLSPNISKCSEQCMVFTNLDTRLRLFSYVQVRCHYLSSLPLSQTQSCQRGRCCTRKSSL